MTNKPDDILSDHHNNVDQEKLLEYLNKQLNEVDQHAVEKTLNDDPFTSDAMDGLQQFDNKAHLSQVVSQLNSELKKELAKKKRRKEKRVIPKQTWAYIALAVILLLCVMAYLVIRHATTG